MTNPNELPSLRAEVKRLQSDIYELKRRFVAGSGEGTGAVDNFWFVSGKILLNSDGAIGANVSFDPVAYPTEPLLFFAVQGPEADLGSSPVTGMALIGWTISGGLYVGAQIGVWRSGTGSGNQWTFQWTVAEFA